MRTAPSAGCSRILGLGGFTNYLKSGDNHASYGKFHSGLDSDQPADPCAGPADAGHYRPGQRRTDLDRSCRRPSPDAQAPKGWGGSPGRPALEVVCCNLVLKPLVARVRPCDINTAVQLLIARPDDFSFPSGHTGASFAAVSALCASGNRLWIPSLILAVLIAFSRLYLYVHYLTDILAGAVIGIMAGWIGTKLADAAGRGAAARLRRK